MTPARVVPSFDPVEDRVGELVAGLPLVLVEELELKLPKKLSATLLSKQSLIEPIDPSSPAAPQPRSPAARERRPKSP